MNLQLIDPVPEYFGHKIRVLVDIEMNNAPWFVAADVCRVLGLNKNTVNHIRKLDTTDVADLGVNSINTFAWKGSKPKLVSEPGFYELVLGSRKPGAVAFKRWVCSDVLPAIRRTGEYTAHVDAEGEPIDIPEVMVDLVRLTDRLPSGAITEMAQRLHLREWIEDHGLEGMKKQYRAAFGKICRRLMLTHDLPILSRWGSRRRSRNWKDEFFGRVYPEAIIEMAYGEYLKGRRD